MNAIVRTDWQLQELDVLYDLPFMDLLMQAQQTHRRYFNPNQLQASTLISIKQAHVQKIVIIVLSQQNTKQDLLQRKSLPLKQY